MKEETNEQKDSNELEHGEFKTSSEVKSNDIDAVAEFLKQLAICINEEGYTDA